MLRARLHRKAETENLADLLVSVVRMLSRLYGARL